MKHIYNYLVVIFSTIFMIIGAYQNIYSECNYSGCAPTVGTPDEEYIYRFKFGTIDNTSYTQSNVANYTSLSTDVWIGSNYSIIVFNGNASEQDRVSVFIDWNQDCDFNDTGETYVLSTSDNGWTFTGIISVPILVVEGKTRMRVRMTFNSIPSPCDFSLYGEIEDYSVNVITTPSISSFSTDDSLYCLGSSLQIFYQTLGSFNSGNIFTAQLSDKFGSFDNPINIGSLESQSDGEIDCEISDSIACGDNYYLRITSTSPESVSQIMGPISINALPNVFNIIGDGFYCNGENGALIELDSSEENTFYQLKRDTIKVDTAIKGTGGKITFGKFKDEGIYTIEATSITGCIKMMNGTVIVKAIQRPAQFKIKSGNNIYDKSIDTSYCADGVGIEIGLNESEQNIKYILKLNGNEEISVMDGTGSDLNFGYFKNEGKYTIEAITYEGSCTTTMFGSIKIKRIELPTKYNIKGLDYFCTGSDGSELKLSDSKTGVSYQLLRDGGAVGEPIAGTGNSISFGKQNIAGLYRVEAMTIDGNCTNTMNGSINLREIPSPEITLTGNLTPDFGSNEEYRDASASEGDKFEWSVEGGAIVGDNTGTSVNVDWGNNKSGKIHIIKTNAYGCTATIEVPINLINNIKVIFEADTTKGVAPFEVKFTDKSTGYITYRNWDFGDGKMSPQQNPTHIYTLPGKYTVKLTVGYDDEFITETKPDLITVESEVGVNEEVVISQSGLAISAVEPNPSSEGIRFSYSISNPQSITIAIYNMLGERVASISEGYKSEGTYSKEINISQLPSGAYYLQILGEAGQVNQMINIIK